MAKDELADGYSYRDELGVASGRRGNPVRLSTSPLMIIRGSKMSAAYIIASRS